MFQFSQPQLEEPSLSPSPESVECPEIQSVTPPKLAAVDAFKDSPKSTEKPKSMSKASVWQATLIQSMV